MRIERGEVTVKHPEPVKLRNILVRHPERGEFLAKRVGTKYEAATMAGRAWGMSWVTVAKECGFVDEKEEEFVAV